MGILEDLKAQGATARITEEALYAEALREIEQGIRRDGLWAKALAQAKMQEGEARARYIDLRVQSLRDEISIIEKSLTDAEHITKKRDRTSLTQAPKPTIATRTPEPFDPERNRNPETAKDWLNVLLGAVFVIFVGALLISAYQWLTGK